MIFSFVACITLMSGILHANDSIVAKIRVHAGPHDRLNTPVNIEMRRFAPGLDQYSWKIFERTSKGRVQKPTQMEKGSENRLWWILDNITSAGSVRIFELVRGDVKPEKSSPVVYFTDDGKQLHLQCAGRNVLAYQHAIHPAPDGASGLFARSAYIHPLYSPAGAILTRINPPDHLHHMGLWNPWTKTEFEGRAIDFWNLKLGQGTIRFNSFVSTISGDVFGGFSALQDHVDLLAPDGEKTALRELLEVRVWNIGGGAWLVDYCTTLNCASDQAFLIKEYRYQGFGFRATGIWNDENCRMITSQNKDKSNANATRARWCDVGGPTETGSSGIVFMTHPTNYNFPEQLRIWPVGANNGEGNVFFNFNPTQDRDWLLKPGKTYTLRYRMYVYDGISDGETPERLWNEFAHPPVVEVNELKSSK